MIGISYSGNKDFFFKFVVKVENSLQENIELQVTKCIFIINA